MSVPMVWECVASGVNHVLANAPTLRLLPGPLRALWARCDTCSGQTYSDGTRWIVGDPCDCFAGAALGVQLGIGQAFVRAGDCQKRAGAGGDDDFP